MSDSSFTGRVALITGGQGVIGSAITSALRQRGVRVVSADGSASTAWERLDATALSQGSVQLDVADSQAIAGLVSRIDAKLGPVDLLVNVAGVVSFGDAATLSEAEWDRVMSINLKGSFLACQAVMPGMKRLQFGRILNIGSVVGKNAGNARPWLDANEQERAGNVAYGVSKAGVHAMTGFLAKELASYGITVNAIAPGPIATPMTSSLPAQIKALIPVGRMGTPHDIVHAALFLSAREASFITGEVLDVNGGMLCD